MPVDIVRNSPKYREGACFDFPPPLRARLFGEQSETSDGTIRTIQRAEDDRTEPKNQWRTRAVPLQEANHRQIEVDQEVQRTAALQFQTTFPDFDAAAYRANASG
jgi:hypothetical protein